MVKTFIVFFKVSCATKSSVAGIKRGRFRNYQAISFNVDLRSEGRHMEMEGRGFSGLIQNSSEELS
ncbi:hypothetical protein JHK82_018750 [Glycine max]|nr:hypothetical protein JHK82_018750 [Glycine max]